MLFNGSAGNEIFAASANGGRLIFTRNLGNIVMDTDDIEVVDLNALGNTDTLTVNDLAGTDVTDFGADLAGTIGGNTGDGAADNVIVNGTNGDDVVVLSGSAAGVSVAGLATQVSIANAEAANDRLTVNGLAGDDVINASAVASGAIALTLDGGNDRENYFAKPSDHPSMGSICQKLGMGRGDVPPYVIMPAYPGYSQALRRSGPYGGYLGAQYDPLFTVWEKQLEGEGKFYEPTTQLGAPVLPSLSVIRLLLS
jgi:hypothetical protein